MFLCLAPLSKRVYAPRCPTTPGACVPGRTSPSLVGRGWGLGSWGRLFVCVWKLLCGPARMRDCLRGVGRGTLLELLGGLKYPKLAVSVSKALWTRNHFSRASLCIQSGYIHKQASICNNQLLFVVSIIGWLWAACLVVAAQWSPRLLE